jgi:hypothetical protein
MRRFFSLLGTAAVAAFVTATLASASPRAEQLTFERNDVLVGSSAFWSDVCGFDVTVAFVGTARVTLIRNDAGLVVRELDSGPQRLVYSSPNGSFSFHASPSQWDYGSGAMLGSTAVVTFPGLAGHVPGLVDSDAGMIRIEGTVVAFEDGIPIVDFEGSIPSKAVGNFNEPEEIMAAICGGLD